MGVKSDWPLHYTGIVLCSVIIEWRKCFTWAYRTDRWTDSRVVGEMEGAPTTWTSEGTLERKSSSSLLSMVYGSRSFFVNLFTPECWADTAALHFNEGQQVHLSSVSKEAACYSGNRGSKGSLKPHFLSKDRLSLCPQEHCSLAFESCCSSLEL